MASNNKKPSGIKSAPALVDLSPPTVKKRKDDTAKRELAPLPEVKTDDVQVGKNQERSANAPQRTQSRLPELPPRSAGRTAKPPAPRLGQGAYARKKRRRFRYSLTPAVKRILSLIIALAVVGTFAVMILLWATSPNALAVYLNDLQVGYMPMDRETTSESFHEDVIAHIEGREQTNIITSYEITVRSARLVSGRNIFERQNMVGRISMAMSYQIVARAIYVENRFEVLVRGDNCVDEVVRLLMEPLVNANTQYHRIITPWRVEELVVDFDDDRLSSPLDAEGQLARIVPRYYPYTVQQGDNLGTIAIQFNTTPERIANANNITLDTIIHAERVLQVPTRLPLISIETVELATTEEDIPVQVIVQENPYQPTTHNVVLQEGSVGRQSVTTRTTLVNGRPVREEVLDAVIIRPMVDEITEVGTRPAGVEVR